MVWCSLGAASKDQMVSYDQETNAIYYTYSYSQDISDEVLHTKNNGEINLIAGCRKTKQEKQSSSSSSSSRAASAALFLVK